MAGPKELVRQENLDCREVSKEMKEDGWYLTAKDTILLNWHRACSEDDVTNGGMEYG